MPKRDPKTGRFLKAADTGKPTGAGSDIGKSAGADSATGKDAVGIQRRRRVGGRPVCRWVSQHNH